MRCAVLDFGVRLFGSGFVRQVEVLENSGKFPFTSEIEVSEYESLYL